MYRNSDSSRLISNSTGNSLTDPPGSIGTELKALIVIKLFYSLQQTEITLLDKIQEQHATTHIALRNADNQSEISLSQLLLSTLASLNILRSSIRAAALCHKLSQTSLLISLKQGLLTDFLKIHSYRVIYADTLRHSDIQVNLCLIGYIIRHVIIIYINILKNHGWFLIVLIKDALLLKSNEDIIKIIAGKVHGMKKILQIITGKRAPLLLSIFHQCLNNSILILCIRQNTLRRMLFLCHRCRRCISLFLWCSLLPGWSLLFWSLFHCRYFSWSSFLHLYLFCRSLCLLLSWSLSFGWSLLLRSLWGLPTVDPCSRSINLCRRSIHWLFSLLLFRRCLLFGRSFNLCWQIHFRCCYFLIRLSRLHGLLFRFSHVYFPSQKRYL